MIAKLRSCPYEYIQTCLRSCALAIDGITDRAVKCLLFGNTRIVGPCRGTGMMVLNRTYGYRLYCSTRTGDVW